MADGLRRLGSLTLDTVHLRDQPGIRFMVTGESTELGAKAAALLDLPPEARCLQPADSVDGADDQQCGRYQAFWAREVPSGFS